MKYNLLTSLGILLWTAGAAATIVGLALGLSVEPHQAGWTTFYAGATSAIFGLWMYFDGDHGKQAVHRHWAKRR